MFFILLLYAGLSDDEWDLCSKGSTAYSSCNNSLRSEVVQSRPVTPLKLGPPIVPDVPVCVDLPQSTESTIVGINQQDCCAQLLLSKLQKLQAISFANQGIDDPESKNPIATPSCIKALNLRRSNIKIWAMDVMPQLVSIEELHLGYNSLCAQDITGLNVLEKLTILDLRNNPLGDMGVQQLTPKLLSQLHILDLSFTKITDQGIQVIAPYFSRLLTDFHINGNQITNDGLTVLLKYLPSSMQGLDIGYNKIDNIRILMQNMPQELKILNVCQIDLSVDFFEKLSTKITHLYFSCNALTQDVLKSILKYLEKTSGLVFLAVACPKSQRYEENFQALTAIKMLSNTKNIKSVIDGVDAQIPSDPRY